MILKTERLILRELRTEDFDALYEILSDAETMRHYPAPFDAPKVQKWIARNQQRYQEDGFGLWAVLLKDGGTFIGECGITMQNIHGQMLPEVGYHIHKDHRRKGYAAEAAKACIDFAFEHYDFEKVYSYMKYTNIPSQKTAMKNGLSFVEEYADPVNTRTRVYAISRNQWMHKLEKEESQHDSPHDNR